MRDGGEAQLALTDAVRHRQLAWRCRGDAGEIHGRCRGDAGEMQGRCMGDVGLSVGAGIGVGLG